VLSLELGEGAPVQSVSYKLARAIWRAAQGTWLVSQFATLGFHPNGVNSGLYTSNRVSTGVPSSHEWFEIDTAFFRIKGSWSERL
jgi:hypothetical protein